MRSKKALLNILSSLTLQIVTVICGFIAPRLIIETFGSSVNGVIASISQFLGYIVLLEAGVGGVVRAALYKPLAKKDVMEISQIVKATEKFFRILAFLFIGYSLIIALLFPLLVSNLFEHIFTFTLVLIIGVSTFIQYYFGVTYQIVLQADQKGYITSTLQIFTTIINTVMVIVLIKLGANIHIVKLGSAAIYVIRPILLYVYVSNKYRINKICSADNNAIKQRWDGLGHHIAFFLHTNTDIVVLTLLTNVKEVSVYSVYLMIVSGIEKLTTTFSTGLEAAFGNMIAQDEKEALNRNFQIYEFMSYTITTILFTTTALIILPFVSVYTKGITDANYIRPLFAFVLTAAEAIYCIRLPYHAVVLAAGHFKQTRNGAFMEAFINISLSFILVNFWGIVGVAIGTLCAMLFRTIQYAIYLSKHILERSIWIFIKRFVISLITVFIIVVTVNLLPSMEVDSYVTWLLQGMIVGIIACIVTFIMNAVFYRENLKGITVIFKKLLPIQKSKLD
jgi:O-antigen/teichoic acid export membrane protein